MVEQIIDGFDHYWNGPNSVVNTPPPDVTDCLALVWTTGPNLALVNGLNAIGGLAVRVGAASVLRKQFPSGNITRVIGGFRCAIDRSGGTIGGFSLTDSGTAQVSVGVLCSDGSLRVCTGTLTGTVLTSYAAGIATNSTHHIEFDITINNTSAAYQIWLDGISVISGTGNTRGGTTNNYANGINFTCSGSASLTIDDLYVFDTSGSTNNAVLGTQPVVETTYPVSDSAKVMTSSAVMLGTNARTLAINGSILTANTLYLRKFTAPTNMTLDSICYLPQGTVTTAKLKGVIYSDSSGSANTLLATGAEVVGVTGNTVVQSTFGSPPSLTGGTAYWIGFIADTTTSGYFEDSNTSGYRASNTYTSGAPSTAPAMTSGIGTMVIYGIGHGGSTNASSVNVTPPQAFAPLPCYVSSSNVGDEDLYNFANLSSAPTTIYSVAVSAMFAKSDSGTRTADIRTKSSSTDSAGSASGFIPGTTFAISDSFFATDPATSAAWTGSGVNAAKHGIKVAS